jgi:hypothetical protein
MLLAVTAALGRPNVFTDTDDYYAQGRSIVRAVSRKAANQAPLIDWEQVRYRQSHSDGADEEPVHNQDGARSAYYGLALYLLQSVGALWLVAFAQALAAATLLFALWRAAAPRAPALSYLAMMAGLALATSLPVFTGFAMPDVFAGLSAVAVVLVLIYPDRLGWPARASLFVVLAAAMNFHTSNLITGVLLAALGLLVLTWLRAPWRQRAAAGASVLAAALVAAAAGAAYGEMVKLRSGDDLGRPPFLTARVLADGPGRLFLKKACEPGAKWTICLFKRLPLDDSEDILWSDDPNKGVFNLSDFARRQALERQDAAFALQAVLSHPMAELGAATANWGRQLVNIRLDEPLMSPEYYLRDPYWRTTNLPRLIRGAGVRCGPDGRGCQPRVEPQILAVAQGLAALAALGWTGVRLARLRLDRRLARRDLGDPLLRAGLAALLLIAAVALNAGVCGALSGPFPRYQARIVWLLAAAAAIVEIAVFAARREATPSAAPLSADDDGGANSGRSSPA